MEKVRIVGKKGRSYIAVKASHNKIKNITSNAMFVYSVREAGPIQYFIAQHFSIRFAYLLSR